MTHPYTAILQRTAAIEQARARRQILDLRTRLRQIEAHLEQLPAAALAELTWRLGNLLTKLERATILVTRDAVPTPRPLAATSKPANEPPRP